MIVGQFAKSTARRVLSEGVNRASRHAIFEGMALWQSAHKFFRAGPASLTFLMVTASAGYYPWRHYGSWMADAIVIGALIIVPWHLALILLERPRIGYLVYAFSNIAVYAYLGMVCLYAVTGDSL